MGPRHLSRGIRLGPGPLAVPKQRFNGATAFEPWNLRPDFSSYSAVPGLQWGHGI